MRKTILTLANVLFCAIIIAQTVPQGINYQAVARDTNGVELTNQSLTIKLSVISGSSTGVVSWQETHAVTTNDFGLFTAVIGGGTSTGSGSSATFDVVDWGSGNHYLKIEIDDGGGTYTDMGTNELLSVPYALMAPDDGDWEIGAYGLENVQKYWVRIVGNDTLGELMIAPNSPSANNKSQLLLMEDYNGYYGMNLHYDGSDNKFKIFGKNISTYNGPWLTIGRDNGQIQMPAGAQQDYILTTDSLGNTNWTDPSIISSSDLWETNGYQTWLQDTSISVGIGTHSPAGGLQIRKDYDMGYSIFSGQYTSTAHLSLVDDGACGVSYAMSPSEDYTAWMSFGNSQSSGKWLMGGRPNSVCNGSLSSTYYLPDFKLKYFNSSSGGYTDVLHITQIGSSKLAIGTSSPLANLHVMGSSSSSDLLLTPNTSVSGENSSIFLAEDDDGDYGMKIEYNGQDNMLYFYGYNNGNLGPHLTINRSGGVGINTTTIPSGYKLSVDGKIICEELRVELSGSWPDYVFAETYDLISLSELEDYINQYHHLPGVPSAKEVEREGVSMGEMTTVIMEKVEELTLYLIEANKRIEKLENELKK